MHKVLGGHQAVSTLEKKKIISRQKTKDKTDELQCSYLHFIESKKNMKSLNRWKLKEENIKKSTNKLIKLLHKS